MYPFDGIDVEEVNFTGSKGVVLNPQKIDGKSLKGMKLTDVKIIYKDKYETIADNIVKAFQKKLAK